MLVLAPGWSRLPLVGFPPRGRGAGRVRLGPVAHVRQPDGVTTPEGGKRHLFARPRHGRIHAADLMTEDPGRPFGRLLTAMVTPFDPEGSLDVEGAQRLATTLVDEGGSDGLVISGTTGEAPTTTDAEKDLLCRAVLDAVGDRARVVAGVGSNDTAHTVELARAAERAGAHGVLVVTPYYSKPPQTGILAHFHTVAEATDLPVMVYDIPGRTGVPIAADTLVRLAEHPRIRAVKDAKDDLASSAWVLARTDLAYYSGTDALNLPLLSVGAVGFVSVVSHLVGPRLRELIDCYEKGDVLHAREINQSLLPVYTGLFRTQGAILVKAALRILGLPAGPMRSPLVDATDEQVARLREDLTQGGVALPAAGSGGRAA